MIALNWGIMWSTRRRLKGISRQAFIKAKNLENKKDAAATHEAFRATVPTSVAI